MIWVNSHNKSKVTTFLVSGFSLVVVSLFLYCGLYAVASADDYAYANLVMRNDFWRSQLDSYMGWSSRYTATFLITWFVKYYLHEYWLVPWMTLCAVFSSFLFLYWTLFFNLRKEKHFFLFPVSFFALFLSSSIAGHGVGVINEGFFWLSGAITYQIGAVFYFLFIACFIWMARKRHKVVNLFFTSLFLFFGMGSNETLMLLTLGSVILLLWFYRSNLQISFFVIGVLALACFTIVFFAPGNNVRLSTAEGHDFFSALGICVEKVVAVYFYFLINPFLWLFVIYFQKIIGSLLAKIEQFVPARYFYAFSVVLIYCLYFPVAWSLDSGAPDRLVSFIGFLGLFYSVFIVRALMLKVTGLVSQKVITRLSFLLAVLLFPIFFEPLYVAVETIPVGHDFHASHIERSAYVEKMANKGVISIGVKPIKHNRLLLFRDIDTLDHSIHYARYYGVESVFIVEQF